MGSFTDLSSESDERRASFQGGAHLPCLERARGRLLAEGWTLDERPTVAREPA